MKKSIYLITLWLACLQLTAQSKTHVVKDLKITILSTMLAEAGIGEWGFSALVEADSVRILFDAGARPRTVIENSRELRIDLSKVPTVILSHNHGDHTIGWLPVRNEFSAIDKNALSITHVGSQIFDTRVSASGSDNTRMQKDSLTYVSSGGKIIIHKNFQEIFPGIYLTGQVPRVHPEKNYPANSKKKDASGKIIADDIPEDMSMIIRTEKGLVLLSGCGHSGIINTIAHTNKNIQGPVIAAIGGFHLYSNPDEQIDWTAAQLKTAGIRYFMGAHCTGIEPVYQIRNKLRLKRGDCIVGAVGATFDINKGFNAGYLAR